MKNAKDFFHNINDILLAVIIIALAAGIIFWRMNVIMDYPDKLASHQSNIETEQQADDQNS